MKQALTLQRKMLEAQIEAFNRACREAGHSELQIMAHAGSSTTEPVAAGASEAERFRTLLGRKKFLLPSAAYETLKNMGFEMAGRTGTHHPSGVMAFITPEEDVSGYTITFA